MIVKIMQKGKDNKWRNIKVDKIQGKSLAYYVAEEFEATVCIVYNDQKDEPLFVVANTSDMEEYCEEKDIPLVYASDMLDLLTGDIGLKLVAETFPDSKFINIKTIEPEIEQ